MGQGARAAENGPAIGPEDHVADILAAIDAAEGPVILVAHSYGGRPATGAWDRARDRIGHAVWVEAPAPLLPTGLPADDRSLAAVVTLYPDAASAGLMPPPPVRQGRIPRPLTPMSLRALYGAVPIGAALPGDTPATFVVAESSSLPGLRSLGEALRDDHGWALETLPGGHDLPLENPEALADLLLRIADRTD
jgi:pimeloyl-ACP methyl ester carboxylesterase